MPNVHHIHDHRDQTVTYRGETVHIVQRDKTKDFLYEGVMSYQIPYHGIASSYDNAVRDAKNRIDRLKGG